MPDRNPGVDIALLGAQRKGKKRLLVIIELKDRRLMTEVDWNHKISVITASRVIPRLARANFEVVAVLAGRTKATFVARNS